MKNLETDSLQLIPKMQNYIEYIIEIIIKLPRTEKFNIGNEYKQSMYQTMRQILYLTKEENNRKIKILNEIDNELNLQRIFLRIMNKYHWIDNKKYRSSFRKNWRNRKNTRRANKILWQEQYEMNLIKI